MLYERKKQGLEVELIYLEANADKPENKRRLKEVKAELAKIAKWEESFYNDPMTQYYGV